MYLCLMNAIKQGQKEEALDVLDNLNIQKRINEQFPEKDILKVTLLYKACESGQVEIVGNLLNIRGIDVNKGCSITAQCRSPLHIATKGNCTTIVKLLLEAGAEISPDMYGETAIHYAAEQGNDDILRMLLQQNSSYIDYKSNCGGFTPLHEGVEARRIRSVEVLLAWRANACIKNDSGKTALDIALQSSNNEIISCLKNHIECNYIQSITRTDLLLDKIVRVEKYMMEIIGSNNQNGKQVMERLVILEEKVETIGQSVENLKNCKNAFQIEGIHDSDYGAVSAAQRKIRKNVEYLKNNMYAMDHVDYLYQEQALSLDDVQIIRSNPGDYQRNRELVFAILAKKNCAAAEIFVHSLEKQGLCLE